MAETVKEIPLDELYPFPDHPFGVRNDDTMQQTVESVREYGILVPGIARPREDGGYEILSQDTEENTPAILQDLPPCRLLFGILTVIPLPSSWWTVTCREKIFFQARKPKHTK